MQHYPVFRAQNILAYVAVMIAWGIVSALSVVALTFAVPQMSVRFAIAWSMLVTMAGMGIMFVASLMNLRKMVPGFRRLADGERDPDIPPVWCPVLTAATNAALELASSVGRRDVPPESPIDKRMRTG